MLKTAEILERGEASLEEVRFPRLLWAVGASRRTVVAELSSGPVVKRVVFENGVPVDCRSNLVHETLSRFMVQKGILTREREAELLQLAAKRAVRFGRVLRDEGIADGTGIYRMLQQNLAKKLLDLFTWVDGTFRLLDEAPEVDSPLAVNVPQLILTGCARFVPSDEIRLGVGHLVGVRVGLDPEPALELASLRLTEPQRRVIRLLAEPRGLSELTGDRDAEFEEITRLVYALLVMDALLEPEALAARKADQSARADAPTEELPEMAELPVLPEAGAEAIDEARLADDVMTTYLEHRRVDARGLLGVTALAPPEHVKARLLAFCRRFAPWQFERESLRPLAGKASELFFAGIEAYAEITRGAGGARPVSVKPPGGLRITRRAADELSREPELIDPEVHFERGLRLRERGEYAKALKELEMAAKFDPQNALYRAEAAYCWYECSPGTGAAHAIELLEEVVRIDRDCGLAVYYLGDLFRVEGRFERAEEHLRRSIKMLAPDRRPIDALREMGRTRRATEEPS